jgi:hypothetical protein
MFLGAYCLLHQIGLMTKAKGTSDMSVNFYHATRRSIMKTVIIILAVVTT